MLVRRFLLGAFLAVTAALAPASAAPAEPAWVARTNVPGLEVAESLLKVLTNRSLELQDRNNPKPVAAPAPAVEAKRPRLASRMSGQAGRRPFTGELPKDLAGYVALLSRYTPGGKVTGRFHDWRSPSVYRLFGGLHNGYDIAFAAGAAIVAGWPGKVTAVTPWAGREYGVSVLSPDGFVTTYGHLAPSVRVGAWVEPGDVVGFVVYDHVDIKMKDAKGKYVDFARGVPLVAREPAPVPVAPVAPPPAPLVGPEWTKKPEACRAAVAYVRFRIQEATMLMSGAQAPATALALVRRQLAETRSRLLLHGVPEEVLLAAFVESPALQSAALFMGDAGGDPAAGADLLGDWLKRQQMMRDARSASPELKALLKDLGAAL